MIRTLIITASVLALAATADAGEPARREDPGIDDVDPRPAPEPDGTAGGSGGEVRNQGDDAQ